MKALILAILSFFGIVPPITPGIQPAPTPMPAVELRQETGLLSPVADFHSRITKKPFGFYVNPNNSPVSPERFTGYHTAVDIEYGDVPGTVTITSIADGEIIFSGWAQGYGGVVAQKINYQQQDFVVIYGHLRPDSQPSKGAVVTAGQPVGILGEGYTSDTDNERKHLHFGIVKGSSLKLLGYVQQQPELSDWLDPLQFYPAPTPM